MERPEQHVTDSLGETQLRAALEPFGWALSKIAADYGIDLDVEVFKDGKSTGITFKIQLKSSRSTSYSSNGDFVSQPLEAKGARYLIHEMETPTILVHADVENRRLFWVAPQLQVEIAEKTRQRGDNGTLTFRIPTAHSLPETVEALLRAVGDAKVLIATRTITQASVRDFVSVLGEQSDAEAASREFRNKADALEVHRAFELMSAGRLGEAEGVLRTLWDDPRTRLEVKFSVALTWEQVETRQAIQEGRPDHEREMVKFRAADRLDSLVDGGPPELRGYALMFRKVAEFDLLLREFWGVQLRLYIAKKQGISPLAAAEMAFRLADITARLARKMQQCYRLVNYAARSRRGYALADPIVRLAKSMVLLRGQFQAVGEDYGATNLDGHALELLRLAAALSERIRDEESFMRAVVTARLISDDTALPSYQWMVRELAKVRDPNLKSKAEDYIDRINRRAKGEELPFTIQTTERQVLENLALGVGINVSDPRDPIARAVQAGILDADPTRVLRDCEHLSVEGPHRAVVVGGIPLPVGAPRAIVCGKHGYRENGQSLDDAYASFREKHCQKCPDRSPRPADWTYVDEE